jgi:hypothetical protein
MERFCGRVPWWGVLDASEPSVVLLALKTAFQFVRDRGGHPR